MGTCYDLINRNAAGRQRVLDLGKYGELHEFLMDAFRRPARDQPWSHYTQVAEAQQEFFIPGELMVEPGDWLHRSWLLVWAFLTTGDLAVLVGDNQDFETDPDALQWSRFRDMSLHAEGIPVLSDGRPLRSDRLLGDGDGAYLEKLVEGAERMYGRVRVEHVDISAEAYLVGVDRIFEEAPARPAPPMEADNGVSALMNALRGSHSFNSTEAPQFTLPTSTTQTVVARPEDSEETRKKIWTLREETREKALTDLEAQGRVVLQLANLWKHFRQEPTDLMGFRALTLLKL